MHPTIDLDFMEIAVYTALVALGAAVGVASAFLYLRLRSKRKVAVGTYLDAAFVVFVAGLVGARAYHVLLHWDYYSARPEEIVPLGTWPPSSLPGGFGMRGALIAGLLALAIYAALRRLSFWRFADAAAFGLSVGQAIGWAGALAQGANYGVVSDSRLAQELPDLYGLVEPRFPLQLAEIALFALLFLVLALLALQKPGSGTLLLTYLVVASAGNLVLGFQRGDETTYIGMFSIDQVIDLVTGSAALAALTWRGLRTPRLAPRSF